MVCGSLSFHPVSCCSLCFCFSLSGRLCRTWEEFSFGVLQASVASQLGYRLCACRSGDLMSVSLHFLRCKMEVIIIFWPKSGHVTHLLIYFTIFLLVLGQRQRLYHVLWGSAWFSFLHLPLVPSAWARLALNLPCSLCPQRKPFVFGSFLSSPLGFVSAKISVQTSSLVTTSPWSPPPCHLQALIASLLWSVLLAISTCSPSSQSSSAPSQYLEQSLAGVEKYTHRILSFQGWDVFVAYQNIYNIYK